MAAVLVCLVVGYADLARGGITLSAILLALGYCAAIPWAILTIGAPRRAPRLAEGSRLPDEGSRPPYVAAGIAALAIFGLYLITLSPSTAMWDASEYIAAAHTFGLPHPPGNPLFVILGRVFAMLPIAPNVAMRVNVLAAVASAVAAGVWFLVSERVTCGWFESRWRRYLAGALSAVIGGTAFTVWNQSVVNEKVYTISLAGIAIVSWLMLRWSDRPDGQRADRLLVLVAYLLGLGYANHMAGMLPLPAVGLVVLVLRPRSLVRWRLVLAALLATVIGVTPFATQPIRSAYHPPINEGEPTACREGFALSCTFSEGTYRAFAYNFNREQYGKPALVERQAPIQAQIGMWWLYFRWQWIRDVHQERPELQAVFAALFLVLGFVGGVVHYRRDRRGFLYFGPLMLLTTLVLIYYLNFRYGASQHPGLDVLREVRDRDYFYIWSFSAWGVWAALGLVYVWESLAGLVRQAHSNPPRGRLAWVVGAPVLFVGLVPLVANWSAASRRDDDTTIAFARDLLNSVEPYGVLVTAGDNDTFPLWYAQEVEGVRKDVVVAVLSLMNTDWFARGLIRRPVFEYDSVRGPASYRGRSWPKPDGPPLRMTFDEADSVPAYLPVPQPLRFQQKGLDLTIDPRALPQTGVGPILERSDLLVLRMIADSWPQRPIYISRTAGNYAEQLGLGHHMLAQGLARKVIQAPPVASADTVYVPGSGWFDVRRSRELWRDFTGPAAIVRRNDWVDRPSLSTVFSYLLAGGELADAMRARGDLVTSTQTIDTVTRLARAVRVEQLLQADALPPVLGGDTAR
ncbi:MAG: glycosyltransferase family 117 protein [Gemmatimonadaceae bacterium]